MKAKRVLISMPEEKYNDLKERAKKSGMTFSSFMTNSASDVIRYDMTPVRVSSEKSKN